MYCTFFGLQEKPFNVTPDPRFLFLSQAHQEALGHLLYGIEQRKGFIAVTGEVGTGKTLLCRALLDRLGRHVRTALILNSFMSEIELLRSINEDFGIASDGATRKALIDALNAFLLDEFRDERNAVLIIDEGQNLAPAVLEQIRMLSNLETERGKLLQIVLVGQPELRQQLARPELRQLNQRIALRYHLRPFDRRETGDYINHRLLVAGSHGGVRFTPRALKAIFHCSQGIARKINLICDGALLLAYVQGTPRIDHHIIQRADAELAGQESRQSSRVGRTRLRRALLIAQGVFVGLALTAGGVWLGYHRPKNPEVAGLVFGTPPAASDARQTLAPPPAHDDGQTVLEPVMETAPSQLELPPPRTEGLDGGREAAGPADVQESLATAPTTQTTAAPRDAMQTGLEGDVLLRALLWEYDRTQPQRTEGVKALLTSVAASFGLEMIAVRTDLQRLKQFRLACLVETYLPTAPTPALLILRATNPEGVAMMEASGEVRRFTDEEFMRLWSGRAYLFHRNGLAVRHILVRGQQGPAVLTLQQRLRQLGYLVVEPVGIFDNETAEAVRSFQRDHALQVDGAAGPATKIMLAHLIGRSLDDAGRP
jgi:general secretion pathway protein A